MNFACAGGFGVDESFRANCAGFGVDVVVGGRGAGDALVTVPDGQLVGAGLAGSSVVKGKSPGAEALALLVLSLVLPASLADESLVVPAGRRRAGHASTISSLEGSTEGANTLERVLIIDVCCRAARERSDPQRGSQGKQKGN